MKECSWGISSHGDVSVPKLDRNTENTSPRTHWVRTNSRPVSRDGDQRSRPQCAPTRSGMETPGTTKPGPLRHSTHRRPRVDGHTRATLLAYRCRPSAVRTPPSTLQPHRPLHTPPSPVAVTRTQLHGSSTAFVGTKTNSGLATNSLATSDPTGWLPARLPTPFSTGCAFVSGGKIRTRVY